MRETVNSGRANLGSDYSNPKLLNTSWGFEWSDPKFAPRVGRERRRIDGLDGNHVRRYLTSMKTTISSKGQIVIPAQFRQQDSIEAGQEFDIERLDRGEYRLVRRAAPPNEGVVDWLLACPEKGFFVPIESESTDTL